MQEGHPGQRPAQLGPYSSLHPQSVLSASTARPGKGSPEHAVVSALRSWPQIRARDQGIGTICVSFKCGRHPSHPSRAAVLYLHPSSHQGSASTATELVTAAGGDSSGTGSGSSPQGLGTVQHAAKSQNFLLKTPFATSLRDAGFPSSAVLVWGLLLGTLLAGRHGWEGSLQRVKGAGSGLWNNPASFVSSAPVCPGWPAEIPAAPPTTAASSAEEPAGTC